MPVKEYILSELISTEEIRRKEGQFFDRDDYTLLIDHDADVYVINTLGQKKILFYFRKQIIPDQYLKNAIAIFKHEAMKGSSTRGTASGVVDPEKMSSQIVGVVTPNRFKSQVIYKNGEVSKYFVSNKVNSLIAGYFDKPKLSEKSEVLKTHATPCRLTAFTEKNWAQWQTVGPLIQQVNDLYKNLAPTQYREQKALADKTPQYVIQNTAFSTVTVNYNWRTACHVDNGDYQKGLSAIVVGEEGQYTGGCLGYPQYGVCVDVRHGDFILKDPHEYHCNTAIHPISPDFTRLSMIFYYRENIQKCATNQNSISQQIPQIIQKPKLNSKIILKPISDLNSIPDLNPSQVLIEGDITSTPQYKVEAVAFRNRQTGQITPLRVLIRPDTTDIKVIDEVLVRDVYEKKKLNFYIEPQETWLDLGGNIGTFALVCLAKGANVITYEPEVKNCELLRGNLERNFPYVPNWQVIQKAVGVTDGQIDLYLCNGDYNKYRHTIYTRRGRTSVKIPIVSIWNVFKQFPQINAVKMDIEGAEIEILEQMTTQDWNNTKVTKLVYEYSFDIDDSIPRFLQIIAKLRTYFDIVEYSKVKDTELYYNHFPAATLVYCLKSNKVNDV